MILSEYQRRWSEIQMYYFVKDMFNIHKDSADVVAATDAICKIGKVNTGTVRTVITKMLNDPYFIPYSSEVIILGRIQGMSDIELARLMKMSRQGIYKHVKYHKENYEPYPRYEIDEDQELYKFLETWNTVRKAGIVYDNSNKSAV